MARAQWPLRHGRPIVEVSLALVQGGQRVVRRLLADTGAGDAQSGFELLLPEQDCLSCGGTPLKAVVLGGAYVGSYPVYLLDVQIPMLGFKKAVPAVAVPSPPSGFDGIACFRFLNRWTYGNFGDRTHFGLEG
ncbi:MAG TPA: hypothetical protein VGN42_24205 [Pirellulales bacterium]|jgi:hypothetical protein|nr:hypothetical protein [Pirellulales bacterium]